MVELLWDGKYDANGKRVAPVRVALPFQTVETVNESAQQRQKTLDLFAAGRDTEWRNRLIWGDKKYVLPALLEEFAGKVDLVYIDPPFATGADFSFQAQVGEESFEKEPSIIEQKAYRDTFGRGLDGYYAWFYEMAVLLYELLSPTGSIYVHCDWRVNSGVRLILDEVFGVDQFLNEVIWKRSYGHGDSNKSMGRAHDNILIYTKGENATLNSFYHAHTQDYIDDFFRHKDARGTYKLENLTSPSPRPNLTYSYKGYPPPQKGWRVNLEKMIELDQDDRLYFPGKSDGRIMRKVYLHELEGQPMTDMWTDIKPISAQHMERLNYPTQKPEALLERIINASSNPGDLVLDCFCGSGTTAAVAEKLGRRWITCDLGRFAIHTARKRLLAIENVRPFVVQNLGKYERQVWQKAEFGDSAESRLRAYRQFILDLYHADPFEGFAWLHGIKAGRLVHVGTVDAPIAQSDITQIAAEFRRALGAGSRISGVDVLGWDFALDANETIRQTAQAAGIDVRFVKIPREVLEKKAVEQNDILFFELAALAIDVQQAGRSVAVTLTDFMVPRDDVPADVIKAVKKWSEWIDYWAIDWNFRDDTFHNEWQSYRTRKDRTLLLTHTHTYDAPGEYVIMIKVIDILGNDTTKAIAITLP